MRGETRRGGRSSPERHSSSELVLSTGGGLFGRSHHSEGQLLDRERSRSSDSRRFRSGDRPRSIWERNSSFSAFNRCLSRSRFNLWFSSWSSCSSVSSSPGWCGDLAPRGLRYCFWPRNRNCHAGLQLYLLTRTLASFNNAPRCAKLFWFVLVPLVFASRVTATLSRN